MPLAIAKISAAMNAEFTNVLTGRSRIVNLPADVQVRRMIYDIATDCMLFQLESAEFQERAAPHDPIPSIELIAKRVDG